MITHNNKLEIFDRFQIDNNLPKHREGVETDLTQSGNDLLTIRTGNNAAWGSVVTANSAGGSFGVAYVDGNGAYVYRDRKPWKIVVWFKKLMQAFEAKKAEKKKAYTIIQFFSSLATSLNDLKTLTDIAVHYETSINNALIAGQTALAEQLRDRLTPAKSEAQLVTYGLNKYLTEQQVVEFYNKAQQDRNLKLTWIKNFIKPIPTKLLELKAKLDALYVFDNYVILHYDPNNDATNLTKKEQEELKKDPILFGVIDKSRRLYYVGDWVDEYCDLTLDTVIETLGEEVGVMNNDSVKTFIDRGFPVVVEKVKPTPPEPRIIKEGEQPQPPPEPTKEENKINDVPKKSRARTQKRRK